MWSRITVPFKSVTTLEETTMNFVPPTEYIRLRRPGWENSVALVPIPIGATRAQCVAYLREVFCGFLKSPLHAASILRALGDNAPKMGRLVHITTSGEFICVTGGGDEIAFVESFSEGDVLCCCRSWVYDNYEELPKEPFTGKRKVIDTEVTD